MKFIEIIKKNIIAAVAVATVVGFSAFKLPYALQNDSLTESITYINPQWFTYSVDPNSPNFATEKLDPANYTPTGNSEPSERPCNDVSEFCGIYAETTMVGAQEQPDLSSGQPVHSALSSYNNGDGPTLLIDEKQP